MDAMSIIRFLLILGSSKPKDRGLAVHTYTRPFLFPIFMSLQGRSPCRSIGQSLEDNSR